MGFRREAQELLRRNVEAFDLAGADAVVVNAAGCGSTLKESAHWARDLPWAGKAQRFASQVQDISEFLQSLGLVPPTREVRARVAYDDPCHLLHGQGIAVQPREILAAIPGVTLLPLPEADRCCGSAGVYNVLHPELAQEILDEKIRCIAGTGADTVATGNPGCILQIRQGLRRAARREPRLAAIRVLHPMQLLASAYATAPGGASGLEQA
jgi:glycolate oxidase iron-sulfur subunit